MTTPKEPQPAAGAITQGLVGLFVAGVLFAVAALIAPDAPIGLYDDPGDSDGASIVAVLGALAAVYGFTYLILGIYRLVDGFDRATKSLHRDEVVREKVAAEARHAAQEEARKHTRNYQEGS